jgi:hypothetical protein
MALVQIAHRRDERSAVLAAQLVAQFVDRADDFHDRTVFLARYGTLSAQKWCIFVPWRPFR